MGPLNPSLLAALLLAGPALCQDLSTGPVVAQSTPAVTVTLTAVGDIRLDGPVGAIISREGPEAPLTAMRERLKADIIFGNLECPVTQSGTKLSKKWNFRAPPRNLAALKSAGFNILNIANNHVMDYGRKGFMDTLAALEEAELQYIGGGKDRADAERLRVIETRGLRVGFLGFTSTFPESAWAGTHRPGVAYSDFARVGGVIRDARSRCDVLVVSFHGGTELAEEPNVIQRGFAHLAINSGADLFLGHHPHVIQPIEVYQGKPILYSLGNFLFSSPSAETFVTAVARVKLTADGVASIEFLPVETNWGRPIPARAAARQELTKALDRYGILSSLPERFKLAE